METSEIFLKEAAKYAFETIKNLISNSTKEQKLAVEVQLEKYLTQIARWSERIEFYGLSIANDTDEHTVGLMLSTPRKFSTRERSSKAVSYTHLTLPTIYSV